MAMPSGSRDPSSEDQAEQAAAGTLGSAVALGFVGGALDAFLYLEHGHVFAGAMTGNAVLFGIALLTEKGMNTVHHALPLIAFLCGVWLAEIIQTRLRHHTVTVALAIEAVGVLAASFLPRSFPDPLYVFLIALLAAFQIASFRKADKYSYNSTFITGDLRNVVVSLYEGFGGNRDSARKGREIGLIVLAFLLGAIVSAALSPRLFNHTLWVPLVVLVVVFLVALKRSLTGEAERSQASEAHK